MLDATTTEPGSPARRIVLMIAGLVLIAGSFAFTVPRRAEIAASMAPAMVLEVPDEMPDMGPEVSDADEAPTGAPAPASGAPEPAATGVPAPASVERTPAEPLPPLLADRTAEPEKPKMQVLTRPIAIDTATFLVGRARVKLAGVEPAPVGKRCNAKAGSTWPCGATARTALRAWLRARSIACEVPADFAKSSSVTESHCLLGERDIGSWLVENGWATAVAGGPYEAAETKARENRLGIWGEG